MASQQDTQSLPPRVHDCLKLLKSATNHQRLAGLDLVTQFRKANDLSSLHTIYHALPPHFLHQLLRSATALASFCRIPKSPPQTTSSPRSHSYSNSSQPSDKGATTLFNSAGFIKSLASYIQILPELVAIKLVQGLLSKVVFLDVYAAELAVIEATLARHFALLHNAAKFDALRLLSGILSSWKMNSPRLHDSLRVLSDRKWQNYMRDGVVDVCKTVLEPLRRWRRLAMVRIFGEGWLIGEVDNVGELDGKEEHVPAD
ncbi:hypothetical protein ACLB2K_066730 [Fragaria x ananassa]